MRCGLNFALNRVDFGVGDTVRLLTVIARVLQIAGCPRILKIERERAHGKAAS